jgi:hypothetical protein
MVRRGYSLRYLKISRTTEIYVRSADGSTWPGGEGKKRELGYASPRGLRAANSGVDPRQIMMIHWHSGAALGSEGAMMIMGAEDAVLTPEVQSGIMPAKASTSQII